MQRIPVNSSNIAAIGYDPDSSILEIEFNDGSIYQYFGVPELVHQELMDAGSHGKYFAQNIKNDYEYKKVN
ncbi:KTSC domain-containing protein [Candidatus Woesebacteria bacterium]|nr:KTSC domain-containing protein [Candidatus Woesebacteria bacterium]